jgi:hypothetical protein
VSPQIEATLTRLEGIDRHSVPVQVERDAVVEATDSMQGAVWAELTLRDADRTLRIEASDGLFQVSYDPYPHRPDYPTSPFWNLEGRLEATDGRPPVQDEVLTVTGADLAEHVEWTGRSGNAIAVPRRWCVLKEQVTDVIEEFLANGRIDVDNVRWCQMEFGPAPTPSDDG